MKKWLKKYIVFLKYISVSIISFLIDILFFNLFIFIIKSVFYATILARIISSFINFLLNKNAVFQNKDKNKLAIIKYYMLVVFQMFVSAFVVDKLYSILKINATLIKIPVELLLFICNYFIQKILIFKNRD